MLRVHCIACHPRAILFGMVRDAAAMDQTAVNREEGDRRRVVDASSISSKTRTRNLEADQKVWGFSFGDGGYKPTLEAQANRMLTRKFKWVVGGHRLTRE